VDLAFGDTIRVRRYLCCCCKRTLSLLPDFALPYLRFEIVVIALLLIARLLHGLTLKVAAESAKLAAMPFQRGQFWVRRFRQQAERLRGALAALAGSGTHSFVDATSNLVARWALGPTVRRGRSWARSLVLVIRLTALVSQNLRKRAGNQGLCEYRQ
jgi:uncharacterized protein DUF6431